MILDMDRITVFGLHSERKSVLEALHKQGVVEVRNSDICGMSFHGTEKSIAQFEKYMKSAEAAIEALDEYAPVKSGFFVNRSVLPIDKYHMSDSDSDKALQASYHIISLSDKIKQYREDIRLITAKQTALEPYLALDVPMQTGGTECTRIKIGALDGLWTDTQLEKALTDNELDSVYFEILYTSKERTYIWFIFLKGNEQALSGLLQANGFAEPTVSSLNRTPSEKTKELENVKTELGLKIRDCIAEMEEYNRYRCDIELLYDHLALRGDKYAVLSKAGMTENVFLLEGYVPQKHSERIKQLLENERMVYVELEKPEPSEDVPIAFQNNSFAAPVEEITETYSMPAPTDIDPNPIMAFFYYLFFGMMFSDAGYGLILMATCGYLGFGKRLEKSKRNTFKMFFFCGVSTVFWGLMYGSFFGNIIHTASVNFWGKEFALAPIWLDPISQAMQLLLYSVAMGMIQILVGLGIKFYTLCRMREILDAIFDVGLWMVTLLGICALSVGMVLGAPSLLIAGKWISIAGAVGLVLTGGRKSKNIFGKILGGVAGLYNITGYMSDALSYCRLMALGLATGSISNVVNLLGSMFGNSIIGALMFIIVAVFGHSLNFAMNILGAYVHTNRLQYVEFFSKFYEGGGRKFEPFRMRTKYFRFSE